MSFIVRGIPKSFSAKIGLFALLVGVSILKLIPQLAEIMSVYGY